MPNVEIRKLINQVTLRTIKTIFSIQQDQHDRLEARIDALPAAAKRCDETKLEDLEKQIADLHSLMLYYDERLRYIEAEFDPEAKQEVETAEEMNND